MLQEPFIDFILLHVRDVRTAVLRVEQPIPYTVDVKTLVKIF